MKIVKLFLTVVVSLAAMANFAQNTDAYFGGYEGNTYVAKVWKDGNLLYTLSDGTTDTQVDKIVVQNNDVYAFAGYYGSTVWKNGKAVVSAANIAEVKTDVPSGKNYVVKFKNFCVSGNDVYVAGVDYIWWRSGTTTYFSDVYLKIWKNGTRLYTLARLEITRTGAAVDMGGVDAMCVSNGDLYMSGYANTSSGSNSYMWKNDQELPFEIKPAATAVSIDGNDVYVTGYINNSKAANVYGVWKNGRELYAYTTGTLSSSNNQRVEDAFFKDNDIYAVTVDYSASEPLSQIWKNGAELYNLGVKTYANAVYVSGSDVYAAGHYFEDSWKYKAKVWKNGAELYTLSDGATRADITSIFVVGNYYSGIKELPQTNVTVSFNLANQSVIFSGLQGSETLRFYNISGNLLFSRQASGETENIPVGHLPAGVYFVKMNNGQVLKWMKK